MTDVFVGHARVVLETTISCISIVKVTCFRGSTDVTIDHRETYNLANYFCVRPTELCSLCSSYSNLGTGAYFMTAAQPLA